MGLNLPAAYVSGAALTNQSRFAAATLASLGLTAGFTRNLSLPSGDTITVRVLAVAPAPAVTATSIPTLGEYGLMALASLMAMFGFRHLRRRQS
ncbi:IPTL-CTERM sorting domain-containing protein [Xylophilus sp. Leaf220]|uniref:IPTL-CTERM sorting domain-containing protein n=1 Tax=Xylophilus sp. Leaf220 TaxID=1735686 RepID=UPI002100CEA1|nr:IPTL-CTERM sorting domain-containing protein [Xylophilus sp. Leaf220]